VPRELSPPLDTAFELRGCLRVRCRKRAGGRTELLSLVLVLAASICSALWASMSIHIDATGLGTAPAAIGFGMWSGRPAHSHPGFTAPVQSENRASTAICVAERPLFVLGLADLKAELGDVMGDPLECERAINSQGDTVQLTTTGIAGYVQLTQTISFTRGERYWVQVAGRLLAGDGHRPE
jgi:hypothetical protein